MRVKSWLAVPFCATALVGLGAGTATAAPDLPLPGRTEMGTEHANSICSFSGLNDNPLDPEEGGIVQSYGQGVRYGAFSPSDPDVRAMLGPGTACNGHSGWYVNPPDFEE